MSKVPDRKKLRREYLRKKGKAYTLEVLGGLMAGPSFLLCLVSGCVTLCLAIWFVCTFALQDPNVVLFPWVLVGIGVTAAFGWVACYGCTVMDRGVMAGQIPAVPPVTPDTLPADEILVRGSEEPLAALSEVLLRAANEQEIAQRFGLQKEALLRVTRE